MAKGDILLKIKQAGLVGRGGGCFPTADKWQMVKNAPGKIKYVVCNSAEGEPGVKKDLHIWQTAGERIIDGMMIAIDFLRAKKGIIYINPQYLRSMGKRLKNLISGKPIELFDKPPEAGYIGGEESAALNAIEGKKIEPRLRPPFPTTNGLFNCPTLINNVETFYNISLAAAEEYKGNRFYTIDGDCLWNGVYEFPSNFTIEKILKETKNWPDFPFFVQAGGDASGEVLNDKQLKRPAVGAGSISIYSIEKHDPKSLMFHWINFFANHSCGQCTPCREGTYRLREIFSAQNPDWHFFAELLDNLSDAAFCGLGCAVPIPINSYVKNVLPVIPGKHLKISVETRKMICDCLG